MSSVVSPLINLNKKSTNTFETSSQKDNLPMIVKSVQIASFFCSKYGKIRSSQKNLPVTDDIKPCREFHCIKDKVFR